MQKYTYQMITKLLANKQCSVTTWWLIWWSVVTIDSRSRLRY